MDMIGEKEIILREGTTSYPLAFAFAPESEAGANDGSIPFGTTIVSATVVVKSVIGKDITADVASDVTVIDNNLAVQVVLAFPADEDNGRCKVYVVLELSDDSVIAKRWDGLVIE